MAYVRRNLRDHLLNLPAMGKEVSQLDLADQDLIDPSMEHL